MLGRHKLLALFAEHVGFAEGVATVGILHHTFRIGTMAQALRMAQFVEHDAEQLAVAARAIGREDGHARSDAIGHSHDTAVRATSEIVQPYVCLRQSNDNRRVRLVSDEHLVQQVGPVASVVIALGRQRRVGQGQMARQTAFGIMGAERVHHGALQVVANLPQRINTNGGYNVFLLSGRGRSVGFTTASRECE